MPRTEPIGSPFPDIAHHIEKSVTIGGEDANRRAAFKPVDAQILPGKIALPRVRHHATAWSELATQANSPSQANSAPSKPPRAANSHSASVGRDFPAQRAYASASSSATCAMGWSSRVATELLRPSGCRHHERGVFLQPPTYPCPALFSSAENGRGKTTLAAILRSLGSGDPLPISERHRLAASPSTPCCPRVYWRAARRRVSEQRLEPAGPEYRRLRRQFH
jgi:hypothetical protein